MITYFKNINNTLKEEESCINRCWVHVVNPNEKEIDFIVEKFNLEKQNIIDGLDIYETPRIEEEGGNIYLFLRVPTDLIEQETTLNFLIVITKNNFITISRESLEIFNKIIESKRPLDTSNKGNFIVRFLSFVSLFYSIKVRNIVKEVKKDRKNLANLRERDITSLVLREDVLNDYLSSFFPLIDIYSRMFKIKSIKFLERDREIIEDLVIDLQQTFNITRSALKSISNMRDYYSTTLSNNLNKVITLLTIFTVFLTIPTLLSSIYGMNIPLPFQSSQSILLFLVGIVIIVWGILFLIFKKIRIF